MVQLPPLHAPVPFAIAHTAPQLPQLFASLAMVVSQPSFGLPLQSAKPGLHAPIWQLPLVHSGPPFLGEHTWPQPPQLAMSEAVFTSQPSFGLPLQSAKPGLQVPTVQAPFAHAAVSLLT